MASSSGGVLLNVTFTFRSWSVQFADCRMHVKANLMGTRLSLIRLELNSLGAFV